MENIIIDTDERIRYITVNRPDQLNALNVETIAELSEAFQLSDQDPDIRAIILTGSGEKAFIAGADIKEFAGFTIEEGKDLSARGHEILFDLVANLQTPVIAAINGFALGGGLELAMSCHIRIASDRAKLGLPEVSLGVIPGYGGTQRLAELVGKGRAMEMILTAGMISAEEAHRIGLVNHVTFPGSLMSRAEEIAHQISKNSPRAIGLAIKAINTGLMNKSRGYQKEIEAF